MDISKIEEGIWEDKSTLNIRVKDHRQAIQDSAKLEYDYDIAYGKLSERLYAEGIPATAIDKFCKQDPHLNKLKEKMNIAKGLEKNYWGAIKSIQSSLSALQSLLSLEKIKIEKGFYSEGD